MNIVKRLYNWVLSWSESKWGALALFILALAEGRATVKNMATGEQNLVAFEEIATLIK